MKDADAVLSAIIGFTFFKILENVYKQAGEDTSQWIP